MLKTLLSPLLLPFVALALAATLPGCGRSSGDGTGGGAAGGGANGGTPGSGLGKDPIRVAAAADLAVAFKEVGAQYEAKTGRKVDFTFGSTGLLAKQLEEGAPFDVFAGANASFVDQAVKSGACDGATKAPYATGRLAIYVKSGTPPTLAQLAKGEYKHIAIANPDHAPYGKAAREAMQKAGVWDGAQKRMVYGENVQQAHQFAQSGNADVAIIALSLAMAATEGSFAEIDTSMHSALNQEMVVCRGRGGPRDRAKDFLDYVASTEGRAVLKKRGFLLPGEARTPAQ
jgi:molybdate transport system substrate-binding protein